MLPLDVGVDFNNGEGWRVCCGWELKFIINNVCTYVSKLCSSLE